MSPTTTTPGCCGCASQPQTEDDLLEELKQVIADQRHQPGALIPVLQIAQGIFGHLPDRVVQAVATGFDKPYSEVAGVVSFYSFFTRQPRGVHTIRVCMGTACYVRGAKKVLDRLCHELACEIGGTTADRQFSLEAARCIGACSLAPAIMIDDEVVGGVQPDRLRKLLAKYKA